MLPPIFANHFQAGRAAVHRIKLVFEGETFCWHCTKNGLIKTKTKPYQFYIQQKCPKPRERYVLTRERKGLSRQRFVKGFHPAGRNGQ